MEKLEWKFRTVKDKFDGIRHVEFWRYKQSEVDYVKVFDVTEEHFVVKCKH